MAQRSEGDTVAGNDTSPEKTRSIPVYARLALHLLGFGIVFAGVLLVSWEHARMSGEM
jgi:hypothetical protein